MKKPSFMKILFQYVISVLMFPFYTVWLKTKKLTLGGRVLMFFLCLLCWWAVIPYISISQYKQDLKVYKTYMTTTAQKA